MGTNHRKVTADSFTLESQGKASKIKGTFSSVSQCDNTKNNFLFHFSFTEFYCTEPKC